VGGICIMKFVTLKFCYISTYVLVVRWYWDFIGKFMLPVLYDFCKSSLMYMLASTNEIQNSDNLPVPLYISLAWTMDALHLQAG
jgi:hypothetical protein